MGQTKERSIFPSIFVLYFVLLVFVFVVIQNIATADTPKDVSYTNETISDFFENTATDIITSNINLAKQKYIQEFDTVSDYSFQKYLSDKHVLQNRKYEPADLVLIDAEHVVIKAGRPYLRQAAATAFDEMAESFYQEMGEEMYVLSAYRTYQDQARLVDDGCSNTRCAKIGASEHQLGLAVDIHVATKNGYTHFSSGYLDRMNENAHKYGFINTYRKGPKIDGKMKEIWHWRYVGVPFATELHEKDMSFGEWVKSNEE